MYTVQDCYLFQLFKLLCIQAGNIKLLAPEVIVVYLLAPSIFFPVMQVEVIVVTSRCQALSSLCTQTDTTVVLYRVLTADVPKCK